jgi:hypothetical protein
MLAHGFSPKPRHAESAVVAEVADVLEKHLDAWATENDGDAPVLVHVDGPGRTLFLDLLRTRLRRDGRWTVVRFDAWQYQRVPPPWWWLIKAIETELRTIRRGCLSSALRRRAADYWMRAWLAIRDVLIALPVMLIVAGVAVAFWRSSGTSDVLKVLQWTTAALAAVTTLVGFGWTATNALRRHLLATSPLGATAVLRTSDPMVEVERRYAFLVRSARAPVAIQIDNLDRCRADYVVELLEGIQTLLREPHSSRDLPPVAFVVAADREWLCESYFKVYDDFQGTATQPGRPFGLGFLDKIFDVSVRIPTVSAAAALADDDAPDADAEAAIAAAGCELDVRRALVGAERAATRPRQRLRLAAVQRLAQLEYVSETGKCHDTDDALEDLARRLDPGWLVVRQLPSAYCVQRITQFLAGHAVDDDEQAISRLGLWTMLSLRWPLLAEHLVRFPDDLDRLCEQAGSKALDEKIAAVFALAEVREWTVVAREVGLDAAAVRRFTAPPRVDTPEPPVRLEPAA